MTSNRARACVGALTVFSLLSFSVASPALASDPSCGRASWYALTSKTASGERMDPSKLTAAHPRLRFGTMVNVVNPANGKSVVVRINDRGPFIKGRIIDVSKAAAGHLGMIRAGVAKVCYHVVS